MILKKQTQCLHCALYVLKQETRRWLLDRGHLKKAREKRPFAICVSIAFVICAPGAPLPPGAATKWCGLRGLGSTRALSRRAAPPTHTTIRSLELLHWRRCAEPDGGASLPPLWPGSLRSALWAAKAPPDRRLPPTRAERCARRPALTAQGQPSRIHGSAAGAVAWRPFYFLSCHGC